MRTTADEQLPRHRDDYTSTKAFEFIDNVRALCAACRAKQDSLRGGLDVFRLPVLSCGSCVAGNDATRNATTQRHQRNAATTQLTIRRFAIFLTSQYPSRPPSRPPRRS